MCTTVRVEKFLCTFVRGKCQVKLWNQFLFVLFPPSSTEEVCSASTILRNHNTLDSKGSNFRICSRFFTPFHSLRHSREMFFFFCRCFFWCFITEMSKSSIECTPLFRWTRIREVNFNMLLRLWAAELFHVEHFRIFSRVHETLHQDANEQHEQGRKDHNQKSLIPLVAGKMWKTTDVVNVKRPELRSKLARWNSSFDSLSELFVNHEEQ